MLAGQHATVILRRRYLNPTTYLSIHCPLKLSRKWRFAGGKIEPNELPYDALVREAKEELGIRVCAARLISVTDTESDSGLWRGYWYLATHYVGWPAIQEPDKHDALEWLSYEELAERGSNAECHAINVLEWSEQRGR